MILVWSSNPNPNPDIWTNQSRQTPQLIPAFDAKTFYQPNQSIPEVDWNLINQPTKLVDQPKCHQPGRQISPTNQKLTVEGLEHKCQAKAPIKARLLLN